MAERGEQTWTLPQIAKSVGAEYRTLKSWRDRGLITPSVRDAGGGAGRADLYSERDACVIEGLVRLRDAGLDMPGLRLVAAQWRKTLMAGCPVCHGSIFLPNRSQLPNPTQQSSNTTPTDAGKDRAAG